MERYPKRFRKVVPEALLLIKQGLERGDFLEESAKQVATKITAENFAGFSSLNREELDVATYLIVYCGWDYEDEKADDFIDFLLGYMYALEEME